MRPIAGIAQHGDRFAMGEGADALGIGAGSGADVERAALIFQRDHGGANDGGGAALFRLFLRGLFLGGLFLRGLFLGGLFLRGLFGLGNLDFRETEGVGHYTPFGEGEAAKQHQRQEHCNRSAHPLFHIHKPPCDGQQSFLSGSPARHVCQMPEAFAPASLRPGPREAAPPDRRETQFLLYILRSDPGRAAQAGNLHQACVSTTRYSKPAFSSVATNLYSSFSSPSMTFQPLPSFTSQEMT